MGSAEEKITSISNQFMKQIEGLFGNDLISVIRYGSSVTGDYTPGSSDINFLVVLTDEGIARIADVRPYLKKWRRKRVSLPLFLSEAYIRASLDSFPVEFLNMQNSYRLLRGSDILADLSFRKEDVRLQCEREVKGYLLKLRQEYIRTGKSKKLVKQLIADSLTAFVTLFRAMIYLADQDIPGKQADVIASACSIYALDADLFSRLASAANHSPGKSSRDFNALMQAYMQEVMKLSTIIDTIKI